MIRDTIGATEHVARWSCPRMFRFAQREIAMCGAEGGKLGSIDDSWGNSKGGGSMKRADIYPSGYVRESREAWRFGDGVLTRSCFSRSLFFFLVSCPCAK